MQKCDSIESSFNGVLRTFPLAVSGVPITPVATDLVVVYNGVVQEPNIDFTVSISNIVFTVAPHVARDCFIFYVPDASVADNTIYRTAVTALGGFRLVYDIGDGTVNYASYNDTSVAAKILGVTLHAASQGAQVAVVRQGQIIDNTFNFTPGLLFLGSNGVITQTPASSGMLVTVGSASTPTTVIIDIQPAIIRA